MISCSENEQLVKRKGLDAGYFIMLQQLVRYLPIFTWEHPVQSGIDFIPTGFGVSITLVKLCRAVIIRAVAHCILSAVILVNINMSL